MPFVLFWQLARFVVWKEEGIHAGYLNSEFYANYWIAFSLHDGGWDIKNSMTDKLLLF
jgi:hypothetical protein